MDTSRLGRNPSEVFALQSARMKYLKSFGLASETLGPYKMITDDSADLKPKPDSDTILELEFNCER